MHKELNIVLTPALPEDFDEILALCRYAAKKTPTSAWNEEYPSPEIIHDDIDRGHLYKVTHEGKIISIMLFRPWAEYIATSEVDQSADWNPEIQKPCALARFCVTPDLQGCGLGRRVMLASLDNARSMGYDGVFFHADKSNPLALHLYDSMGFRRTGEVFEFGIHFVCYEMKL